MTRRNKHAARFGDRYQPPIDWRRFRDGLQKAQTAIHRMTEAFRQIADNMRQAREMETTVRQVEAIINGPGRVWFAPVGTAAPTLAELEAGAPIWVSAGTLRSPDILDRIDDTLLSYDATSQPENRPWPYRSF